MNKGDMLTEEDFQSLHEDANINPEQIVPDVTDTSGNGQLESETDVDAPTNSEDGKHEADIDGDSKTAEPDLDVVQANPQTMEQDETGRGGDRTEEGDRNRPRHSSDEAEHYRNPYSARGQDMNGDDRNTSKGDAQDEEKEPFRQRLLSAVKKSPIYLAKALFALAGMIRQFIRTLLFGPSYATRTEDETGQKLDDLLNSEKVQRENAEKEREMRDREQSRPEQKREQPKEETEEQKKHEETRTEEQPEGPEVETKEEEAERLEDKEKEAEENTEEKQTEQGSATEEKEEKQGGDDQTSGKEKSFSVDKMSASEIEQLVNGEHAKDAMKAIAESFGVDIRVSSDMSHITLVKSDAVKVETANCNGMKIYEYKPSDVSRPIDLKQFLKGDISQMAAACKDIGCSINPSVWNDKTVEQMKSRYDNGAETMRDTTHIMAAAMITAKFRSEILQDMETDTAHKSNRNKTVLAYLPVRNAGGTDSQYGNSSPLAIYGKSGENGTQYQISSINVSGNRQDVQPSESGTVLSCDSIDSTCNMLAANGSQIMKSIEGTESFPTQNMLTAEQVAKMQILIRDAAEGKMVDVFMYGDRTLIDHKDEAEKICREMAEKAAKMIGNQLLGIPKSEIKDMMRQVNRYIGIRSNYDYMMKLEQELGRPPEEPTVNAEKDGQMEQNADEAEQHQDAKETEMENDEACMEQQDEDEPSL